MSDRARSLQSLTLGWWNTGLSPVRGKNPESHRKKMPIAKQIVETLTRQGVDFLALGEVKADDIEYLKQSTLKFGYRSINGTEKVGRTCFDLGILYNAQKIGIITKKFLTTRWAETNTLKTALKVVILPYAGNRPFTIFTSHWPSRLTPTHDTDKREKLGLELRRFIDKVMNFSDVNPPYIIAMGDFNDEPFDKSLSSHLLATRDRGILQRKKSFLYNPFWRHLGEKDVFDGHSPTLNSSCGTYFYKRGDITRWQTFDQMMFSSSFITSDEWFLDEKSSLIWPAESLINKYGFNHLPILSTVMFNPKVEE